MPVIVNQETCIGCGTCLSSCPTDALNMNDDGKAECEESVCISCLACLTTCPTDAIQEA